MHVYICIYGETLLPARTPSASPTLRGSGGFDAADRRRSPTRLPRRSERPDAAAEPPPPPPPPPRRRRRLHLRAVNQGSRPPWRSLGSAAARAAAPRAGGGRTTSWILRARAARRTGTSSGERAASRPLEIAPCLCMFGARAFGKTRRESSFYWRRRTPVVRSGGHGNAATVCERRLRQARTQTRTRTRTHKGQLTSLRCARRQKRQQQINQNDWIKIYIYIITRIRS